jgi:hypothetical protein
MKKLPLLAALGFATIFLIGCGDEGPKYTASDKLCLEKLKLGVSCNPNSTGTGTNTTTTATSTVTVTRTQTSN